jgi:ankyrin repeat protein
MRLLNTTTRKLEEFGGNKIPLYAILSHTWGKNEITFQGMEGAGAEEKAGYIKLRNTCTRAAADGFDYVWIDTCCIDKTSSAELSEAINSMYRWYQESGVCYAYLADMPSNAISSRAMVIRPKFSKSRWFTRGWTLQELIAPSVVIFLNQKWEEIGTKSSLQREISAITGIPVNILVRGDVECASVAQRMSWASKRETTRVEDLAYCLMGIFGINMPLLYGEGEMAFTRLQEEIMKVSDDHSLFAWTSRSNSGGLLATSPAAFSNSGDIIPVNPSSTLSGAITVNNKGIHLKLRVTEGKDIRGNWLAILPCTEKGKQLGIFMRAISETGEYFVRGDPLVILDPKSLGKSKYRERSICVRQNRLRPKNQSSLPEAAAHGNEVVVKLLLEKGVELESKGRGGRTPLSFAAEEGHEAVVKLLLDKGAQLESMDGDRRTPLSWAADNGQEVVVRLLLEKGAQLESKDIYGRTPLSFVAEEGHEAVVKLLLEKGAELESSDGGGRTPLSAAARNGHEMVVKLLLEKGAQLEPKDEYGRTPLSVAAENGHEAVVELLLEKDPQLKSKDKYGRTPLSVAIENGHEAAVKLLQLRGHRRL